MCITVVHGFKVTLSMPTAFQKILAETTTLTASRMTIPFSLGLAYRALIAEAIQLTGFSKIIIQSVAVFRGNYRRWDRTPRLMHAMRISESPPRIHSL